MTPAEILSSAAEARPDLIEKVATAMFVLERTAPEYAAELAADIEEITTYTTEKIAAAPATAKAVALGAAGALGMGLAASVATNLYDVAKEASPRVGTSTG